MDGQPSFLSTYLTPLVPLLMRDDLVEIAVNPDGAVWIERKGAVHMERVAHLKIDRALSVNLGQAIASAVGVQFSERKPTVSGKITWEAFSIRAQVIAAPVVDGGMALTLRPFKSSSDQLIEPRLLHDRLVDLDKHKRERAAEVVKLAGQGRLTDAMRLCIEDRMNILISGGTSTGKTSFARFLLSLVDADERILTIEDAYELFPGQANSVALKADRNSQGERTPARLLEASLRMRPDRIILGELRGERHAVKARDEGKLAACAQDGDHLRPLGNIGGNLGGHAVLHRQAGLLAGLGQNDQHGRVVVFAKPRRDSTVRGRPEDAVGIADHAERTFGLFDADNGKTSLGGHFPSIKRQHWAGHCKGRQSAKDEGLELHREDHLSSEAGRHQITTFVNATYVLIAALSMPLGMAMSAGGRHG